MLGLAGGGWVISPFTQRDLSWPTPIHSPKLSPKAIPWFRVYGLGIYGSYGVA